MEVSVRPIALCGLFGWLLICVASDVRSRRVPNASILVGLALGFAVQAFAMAGSRKGLAGTTLLAPLSGVLIGVLALMPLYALRACGAADVKMMAVVGSFLGPYHVIVAALCTMVAGGLLSLAWMLDRDIASRTVANLATMSANVLARVSRTPRAADASPDSSPLQRTAARMPYAMAIAAGTAAATWYAGVGS